MNTSSESGDFSQRARELLQEKFAPWVQRLELHVESSAPIVLRLAPRPELCRVGGMLCGQAIMAALDTAMVLVVSEALGEFVDMATVTMNTSFLAPLTEEDALISVEITKLGKSMAFGEGRLRGARSRRLCARASLVYALLRR
jgi:acyl-coenzyme A thioesterase PaaI-like protein